MGNSNLLLYTVMPWSRVLVVVVFLVICGCLVIPAFYTFLH